MKHLYKLTMNRVVFVVICLVLQLGWLISTIWKLSQYYAVINSILLLLSVFIVFYMVSKRENPAYKLAWTILILVLPIFGVILYVMFGRSRITRRIRYQFDEIYKEFDLFLMQDQEVIEELTKDNIPVSNISHYIYHQSLFPIYKNTSTQYFATGEENFDVLLKELKGAKHFIFMEYFIVQEGVMWDAILEVLECKVKEGVEVRFMYDDMGCVALLPYNYYRILEEKGIQCVSFNPFIPVLSIIMNHRDHRKITVIDGHTGFTGGINLADEYINVNSKFGHWKDTGIMMKGEAVWNLTVMFLEMWNSVRRTDKDYSRYGVRTFYEGEFYSDGFVQPYCDTPLDQETLGENVYLHIINKAKRYVYIYTPYLIIDNEMMTAMCLAAKSGIDIRIVTPHIPDKKMVFLLTQSYYSQLIDSGVRILEYTPGFVHAKCFVCDDEVATVGTINLDYRSLYLHFECGVFMYKSEAVSQVKADFEKVFPVCTEITKEFCDSRSLATRMMQNCLRLFAPLM